MLIYYAIPLLLILITCYFLFYSNKATKVALISTSHGIGKTQFIMSLLKKKIHTFPTYATTCYKLGSYEIFDYPTNSIATNVDQTYFFYKEGDEVPKSFTGFVVVDDIGNFTHSEFKNIISKKGLKLILEKQ